MILPTSYAIALLLAVVALCCWGSWPSTFKLGRQRFELFYWDYALGVLLGAAAAAFTFGSLGFDVGGDVAGFAFYDDLMRASKHSWAYAFGGGAVFNLGILFLVASTSVAGMSLAFPVGLGLAATTALLLDYILKPHASAVLAFSAVALALAAVLLNAAAYRALSLHRAHEAIKTGRTRSTRVTASWRAVVLAAVGGPFLALAFPLVEMSRDPDLGMGPYAGAFLFSLGMFVSTFLYNLFFMNVPVQGEPIEMLFYFRQPVARHVLPLVGGLVTAAGTVALFVASSAVTAVRPGVEPVPLLGPTTLHPVLLGAAALSGLWGLLVWKESADGSHRVHSLQVLMLGLLIAALALVLVAPPFAR
jgi:glucose uptake protein